MLSDLIAGARWNASLGVKFVRVVPYCTLTIILFTLVSQMAMLAASFLPLKVIIMLGSEGVPRYFPAFFTALGRDVLISFLSAGTVGFFLVHLVSERVIENITGKATTKLLDMSQKMVLFENQEKLAASAYQRYSRSLAGAVFICLAFLGLGWFYPEMLSVILSYFLLILLLFWQGERHSSNMRERLADRLSPLMNVTATTGFFIAFGYLVLDFVVFNPPGVVLALVCFLLIRQAMQRASGTVVDFTSLYRQKDRLNALFFHGQVFQPLQADAKESLWPLLSAEVRQVWVPDVLKAAAGTEGNVECCWHQLSNAHVVALRVTQGKRQFLLKLYEPRRSALALHEADLMSELPAALPAPRWLGLFPVDKFHCLVYELPRGYVTGGKEVKRLSQKMRADMILATPKQVSVRRYMRSKAMLWQRLNQEMVERLYLAANTEQQSSGLASFLAQMPSLKQLLATLPVAVFNAELNQDTIWVVAEEDGQPERPLLLSWGSWTLEPVGAGWPEAEKTLAMLGEALATGGKKRPDLSEIRVEQVELAALAFALERELNRQRYNQALELIPRILARMEVLESSEPLKTIRDINAD